jgi:hypothetical protein
LSPAVPEVDDNDFGYEADDSASVAKVGADTLALEADASVSILQGCADVVDIDNDDDDDIPAALLALGDALEEAVVPFSQRPVSLFSPPSSARPSAGLPSFSFERRDDKIPGSDHSPPHADAGDDDLGLALSSGVLIVPPGLANVQEASDAAAEPLIQFG